jgi:hypothetical protein
MDANYGSDLQPVTNVHVCWSINNGVKGVQLNVTLKNIAQAHVQIIDAVWVAVEIAMDTVYNIKKTIGNGSKITSS